MKTLFSNPKLLSAIAAILLLGIICGAEILYANQLLFDVSGKTEVKLDLSQAVLKGGAELTDGGITLKGGSTVIFNDVGTETSNVTLAAKAKELSISEYTVSTTDDANKAAYRTYVDGRVYTDGVPAYFTIHSSGNVRTLRIQCNEGDKMTLTSVTLNAKPAFRFEVLRVALIYAVAIFLYIAWQNRLWKQIYDGTLLSHRCLLLCVLLVCLLFFAIGLPSGGLEEVPYKDTKDLSAYEQLFASMLEGRVDIDVDVDPAILEQLENPYDYTERNTVLEKFGPFWDRAYYNGNFYCYFGVAPVILFFYPIYFVTGMAPNLGLVTLLVCMVGVLSLFGAVFKIIRYFGLRVPLLLLCTGLPVLILGSMLPMIALCSDMYYLACASGIAFISLTWYLGFAALCSKHAVFRRLLFASCGLAATATLASRPTVVLYAAVLIPPFVAVLLEKGRKMTAKLIDAGAFVLPLVISVVPVLWYNQIRFDSPFEFGATYQMTFSDISYNRIRLSMLGETVMHYFLQFPQLSGFFPYLRPSYLALDTYGSYFYSAQSIGVMSFPLAWAGFAGGIVTKKQPVKKAVYTLLLVLPFVVAFADLCLGGVNIRYATDIALPMILAGLLVVWELGQKVNEHCSDSTSYRVFLLLSALLLVTAFVLFALLFANERNRIYEGAPIIFRFFETFFS